MLFSYLAHGKHTLLQIKMMFMAYQQGWQGFPEGGQNSQKAGARITIN